MKTQIKLVSQPLLSSELKLNRLYSSANNLRLPLSKCAGFFSQLQQVGVSGPSVPGLGAEWTCNYRWHQRSPNAKC